MGKGTDICEEPTAALDDHNASPATPSKTCSKRSIRAVAPEDHLQKLGCTPESAKGYNFEKAMKTKHSPEVSARRKLHMPKKNEIPVKEDKAKISDEKVPEKLITLKEKGSNAEPP